MLLLHIKHALCRHAAGASAPATLASPLCCCVHPLVAAAETRAFRIDMCLVAAVSGMGCCEIVRTEHVLVLQHTVSGRSVTCMDVFKRSQPICA